MEDILDILLSLKDSDGNPLLTTEEIKAELSVSPMTKISFAVFYG